jgi:hypothetical protein
MSIACALGLVSSAGAEPRRDPARAEQAFQQAVELRKRGDLARACPLFEHSQRLDPAPGTLLNIAMCHEAGERWAEAWLAFRQLSDLSLVDGDAERLALARAGLARLDGRVARLVVRAPPGAVARGLRVRVGERLLAGDQHGVPFPVAAGEQVVVAEAPDRIAWRTTIAARPGAEAAVVVPELAPATLAAALTAPRRARAAGWPARRKWALATAGAAVVGLAAGSYFGLRAWGDWNAAADHCNADRTLCDERGRSLIAGSRDAATYADVGFAAAGVAAVAASVLWFMAPPRPPAAGGADWEVTPRVDGRSVAVSWSRRF